MGKLFISTSLTQINWNFLKVLDYFQYPLEGYKYLHENIFCQKRAENIF